MFHEARIKLTTWYLAIIMAISLSFSGVIYLGINRELTRIENYQRVRIQGIINGFTVPINIPPAPDSDAITEARFRIISGLGFINLFILIISGLGGYFLAGITLDPIRKNMDEQKIFVSDASHELRTPLTSLKTEIEVAMRDKDLSLTDAKLLLKSNLEDVDKMQKLTTYLLTMNRYEGGKNLVISKINLKNVVLKAIGKKKIKSNLASSVVNANEDSLVELVTILLDNALKYSPKQGSVMVKCGKGKIEVTDRGMGIAPEDLPHIFDRFYRSDKSRGTEGYGLGLSIAKSIADANGAKIKVRSKPGSGSTFTLVF